MVSLYFQVKNRGGVKPRIHKLKKLILFCDIVPIVK